MQITWLNWQLDFAEYIVKEQSFLTNQWVRDGVLRECVQRWNPKEILIPTLTKGEGDGDPLQYSCLGNPVDRGARQVIVHETEESDMTEQQTHWPGGGGAVGKTKCLENRTHQRTSVFGRRGDILLGYCRGWQHSLSCGGYREVQVLHSVWWCGWSETRSLDKVEESSRTRSSSPESDQWRRDDDESQEQVTETTQWWALQEKAKKLAEFQGWQTKESSSGRLRSGVKGKECGTRGNKRVQVRSSRLL